MKFLIRADGNQKIGMGHIKRQSDLADALIKKGHQVDLLMRKNYKAEKFIRTLGIEADFVAIPNNWQKKREFLKEYLDSNYYDWALIDILEINLDNSCLDLYHAGASQIAVFTDNPNYCSFNSDVVFNPSIEQLKYNYDDEQADYYLGPDYFISSSEFLKLRQRYDLKEELNDILIIMGGGGKKIEDAPLKILRYLTTCETWEKLSFILSPVYGGKERIEKKSKKLQRTVEIFQSVSSVASFMRQTNLIICSAGNVVYEACIAGIPTITINQVEWQMEHAKVMDEKGLIKNLGYINNLDKDTLCSVLQSVLSLKERNLMRERQQNLFSGRGLENTLSVLLPD